MVSLYRSLSVYDRPATTTVDPSLALSAKAAVSAALRLALSWKDAAAAVAKVAQATTVINSTTTPVTPKLPEYSLSEVSDHCSPDDCWLVIYDRVYDVTNFLNDHPGGEYIILEFAGRDATIAFRGSRHGKDSYQMLDKYLIGDLIASERLYRTSSSTTSPTSNSFPS